MENSKKTAVDTGRRISVNTTIRPKVIRSRPPKRTESKNIPLQEVEIIPEESAPALLPKPATLEDKKEVKEEKPKSLSEGKKIPLYVEPLEFDDSGDFMALLKESENDEPKLDLKMGDKATGKVIHIGKDYVFISLGKKMEALMALKELMNEHGDLEARLGQKITGYIVSVRDGILLSKEVEKAGQDMNLLMEALEKKIPVQGKVLAQNKGGFDIDLSGKKAFCPVGQIDSKFTEDPASFIGQTLAFLLERIEEGGRNIVVSRKALLAREQKEKASKLLQNLEVDKTYLATITKVADYGAFADIGGLSGLIPKREISFGHIDKVSDIVNSGDKVEVKLLNFEIDEEHPTKTKLTFSLKKTQSDPFTMHWDKIKEDATLEGKVVRLESFGAFVELFPGIDGLIHISEIAENRVAHPKEILHVGDPVTVKVISVDNIEKRIGLSLRESVRKKRDGESTKLERGQKASGVVSRIERYGVFLQLDSGATALLPQSEVDIPTGSDLHRAFNIGDRLDVVVIDIDAQNRVRVSNIARKQMEERDSYVQFQAESKKSSLGTLADLLKKKG